MRRPTRALGSIARGSLRGLRLFVVGGTIAVSLGVVSLAYQQGMRGITTADGSFFYDNVRGDYGRDGVIKQAIHAELYSHDRPILDYRGQSLLFYVTFFIPRDLWPDKPWPYAQYATSAMLQLPTTTSLGWGITTSILDEAIANLGWAGMLVGPLMVGWMCRLGDRVKRPFAKVLTIVNVMLILVVHAAAFLPLLIVWAIVVLRDPIHRWLGRTSIGVMPAPGRPPRTAVRVGGGRPFAARRAATLALNTWDSKR